MFRAVNKFGTREGFSLIELLITLSIIMVLAAIAVPAFLGVRENAWHKAMEASARGAVTEVHSILESFLMNEPFIVVDLSNSQKCYEYESALDDNRCVNVYMDILNIGTYPQADLDNLVDILIDHYTASVGGTLSVSKDSPVIGPASHGAMVLTAIGNRAINISAYPQNSNVPIFNSIVTSR